LTAPPSPPCRPLASAAWPFRTERRVIDLSSDGRNNRGDLVTIARDEVVARGITINGLPILNEWPTLDKYFQQQMARWISAVHGERRDTLQWGG
jgi:Protein of unknown function (DUF1194)